MINRQRLHEANKKARRRLKLRVPEYWRDKANGIHVFHWQAYRNTGQPCSCPMCGNPRKHFAKKTLAELKFEEASSW